MKEYSVLIMKYLPVAHTILTTETYLTYDFDKSDVPEKDFILKAINEYENSEHVNDAVFGLAGTNKSNSIHINICIISEDANIVTKISKLISESNSRVEMFFRFDVFNNIVRNDKEPYFEYINQEMISTLVRVISELTTICIVPGQGCEMTKISLFAGSTYSFIKQCVGDITELVLSEKPKYVLSENIVNGSRRFIIVTNIDKDLDKLFNHINNIVTKDNVLVDNYIPFISYTMDKFVEIINKKECGKND